ncbi:seryl-tRNA synthetase [Methanospirillum hungatei JF-1]|jgi:seryl-tRNA synthetase|uniref:Serine--tRNA ligase n=1 Tax=Methanospirillum hungatei JF-1 (strain ATCC 27890 / DSM 864 / NBRC 100397 / JF-1) TaxID=323259 RepID=SYS_METHJ|nr:serine--tRNA ligase [Methanospirillum hungatei]Q2FS27.1 RecName: Full=Serine--tRNA ligase; AltName: Full=Seryl-tRNA synthetase; Short=SerRS; AltName: Full=Seryl-tRNA(Ser/Sec) synthetase [Methanospirillum hungatei JF-1]ABD42207.1 seryl-tRNA synthetase [Methanospirillum hungatei JF-1]
MLDIRFVRANPDAIREDLKKRNDMEKLAWIDDLLVQDIRHRELIGQTNELRRRRNSISYDINRAKKAGEDASALIAEAAGLPGRIKENEAEMEEISKKIRYYLMRIPNILHESVPVGADDTQNVEVKRYGTPRTFTFELKNHGQLAADNDWADFERATKTSGAGFYFLKGNLVLLDLALQRFSLDILMEKGYTPIIPPYMINRKSYEEVTDLDDFEKVMYKIEDDDAYLIATSEHPMAAMYQDEIFEEKDLPLRLAGLSPCFRREIGSHGLDTKGLFRVHQFHKVEQFVYCHPDDSWTIHEELRENAEEIFQKLEIPYRVVNICTGDIGTVAAKKYDIEAWMPRENEYREVVSCSNCTTYQAVRLNIRVRDKEDFESKQFVHTLNSTAIATSRAMRAILENNQQEDGSVVIPKVLRPYMNDKEFL